MGMKEFFFFFRKKNSKGPTQKKLICQNCQFSKIFLRKFLRWVLGLVGLNDANGIDVAQRIWSWVCPAKAKKQPKNAFSVHFGCFWAFVGQPHGHIRWATSMPFASFNPTNPRTNLRNFREKFLRIGNLKKWAFFWVVHFEFLFKKKKFFCFIPMKISPNLYGRMDGSRFWCFFWFPENSLLCVILRYTVYVSPY